MIQRLSLIAIVALIAVPLDAARERRAKTCGDPACANEVTITTGATPGGRMSRGLISELGMVRTLAMARLRIRSCRNLFASEGADGAVLLERAEFRLPTDLEQSEICAGRRAALFTHLRGTEIGVCVRRFRNHSRGERVALFLHEALHHAGVSEQPLDPDALTSEELTALVERRCLL